MTASCTREAATPNILILLADDLGTDMVGAYGERPGTPRTENIDALAREGVLFRNVWSNPACSSTRATIQTGRYAFRTGVGWLITSGSDQFALPLAEQTLPETLDAHAPVPYRHAAFGKWHLGNETVGGRDSPNLSGYSHFQGTLFNLSGEDQNYDSWLEITNGEVTRREVYATRATVDALLAWIRAGPEPWFAYVAFHAPHAPYHAPEALLQGVDPNSAEAARIGYRWMVEELDREIGRLLRELSPDQLRNTVIVFAGDNGTPPGIRTGASDARHAKDSLYQAGISVPLIVSGAGISEPGRSSDALVHAVDLFATVAELSGIDPSGLGSTRRPNDSVSFVPHLRNPGAAPLRKTLFAERFLPSGYAPSAQSYALRDSRYKLIFHLFKSASPETEVDGWSSSLQLFDLERDPEEKSDLLARGAQPSHPDLEPEAASAYQRLRQQLHGFASAARSTRSEHRSPR